MNQKIDLTYDKAVQASGGSGEVLISKPKITMIPKEGSDWIIGNVRNAAGQKTADVVTSTNIGDWINGALIRELSDAGYNMKPVSAIHQVVSKGIEVTVTKLFVDNDLIQKEPILQQRIRQDGVGGIGVKYFLLTIQINDIAIPHQSSLSGD